MERFIDDPAMLARASDESRKLAEERYDVRKVNQVMLEAMGLIDRKPDDQSAEVSPGWAAEPDRLKAS